MKKQTIKPTVIIPDTAPLVHLAAGDALHLLTAMGRVVLVDVVVFEATYYQDKPFAKNIHNWIEMAMLPGSGVLLDIAESDIGILYRMALEQHVRKPRNAGEIAITEWLANQLAHISGPILVVYENGIVPGMLARQGVITTVAVATTRNFLSLAQEEGIISDAESLWKKIITAAPTANPLSAITFINSVNP